MGEINSFYSDKELQNIGFKSIGENVKISRFVQIYTPSTITIGCNVRIDDFTILSGQICIGNYVHISAYSTLYGAKGIVINDFSGISSKTTIYSAIDDFSGEYAVGPLLSSELTNVTGGEVVIGKYAQIGASCVVLPNLTIGEGSVVGAMSLVKKSLDNWGIYAGIPCKWLKIRSKKLITHLSKMEPADKGEKSDKQLP